jgi:predicted sulfurtransferase
LDYILNGVLSEKVEYYVIIDWRYNYEYDGGKIKGAKNIYKKEKMLKEFVEKKKKKKDNENGEGEREKEK